MVLGRIYEEPARSGGGDDKSMKEQLDLAVAKADMEIHVTNGGTNLCEGVY